MAIRQTCARRHKEYGVTLIEQIMVVTILGVLAAIATPSLAQLHRRSQARIALLDFIAALQHARGVAILSGRSTLLCPSRDGLHCIGGTHWESGWLISHGKDRDGQPDTAPLRTQAGYAGVTILGDQGRPYVRFDSDGRASGTTNTLRFCSHGEPDQALVAVVSNVGRVRAAPASPAEAASCAAAQ